MVKLWELHGVEEKLEVCNRKLPWSSQRFNMGNIECDALRPRSMIDTKCKLILSIIKYEVAHIRMGKRTITTFACKSSSDGKTQVDRGKPMNELRIHGTILKCGSCDTTSCL